MGLVERAKRAQKGAKLFFANASVQVLEAGKVLISSPVGHISQAQINAISVLTNKETAMKKTKDGSIVIVCREAEEVTLAATWLPNNGFYKINFANTGA
jgi:hypothetical protein